MGLPIWAPVSCPARKTCFTKVFVEMLTTIHDIKPTRSNPIVFQAFASISEVLRKGIRNFKDKVTIGLVSCKVYDRFHVVQQLPRLESLLYGMFVT